MAKRTQKRINKQFIARIFLIVGPLLVALSVAHNILYLRSLRVNAEVVTSIAEQEFVSPSLPFPTHIYIEWFVDVAIDPAAYLEGDWTISPNNASYLASSARPGQEGNIILYGHNTRGILGNIRALKGGETLTLTLSDDTTREYQVVSLTQVSPTTLDLLLPTDSEVLTIYTCSGFLDSQRTVVRATPIAPADDS